MGSRVLFSACLFCTLIALERRADADNWPQWRGPTNNGICHETGIAREWSRDENVAWRFQLPSSRSGSTPVIWGDRIFVTSATGDDGSDLVLICVSTKGEELWRQTVGTGNQNARGIEGNSAAASPSTDGQHVWCFFGTGVLGCYTVKGDEVWKFNVQERYGQFDIQFGMTSTPVLDDGALYLQLLHGAMRDDYTVSRVVKLNAATGDEIWAVERQSDPAFENKHSYASPFMYNDGTRKFLITHGQEFTVAFDPNTGEEIARVGGLNGPSQYNATEYDPTFRFIASPAFADGLVVIPTAKGGPVVAVNINDEVGGGDLTGNPRAVRWTNEKTPDVSIPLILDDLVFFLRKPGQVFAVDRETGEELYYKRIHAAQYRSSPTYIDGHIYCCANDGMCTVLKAGREFEIVAENDLGEPITASPAVSNGTLYLRSFEALYAIRE